KQAGKWDQETIVSFFLCQYCSGEYLPDIAEPDGRPQGRGQHAKGAGKPISGFGNGLAHRCLAVWITA
ncbi:hypothetical protein ACK3YB_14905, partial [Aeromonas caviae]